MLATASVSAEETSGALPLGEVLQGRYRIVRAIGAGGMGVVYEAERTKDLRRFALKVLNGTTSRTALARFAREAQIVSQIDHPNVISIADVDVSPAGVMFIVMELVDGRSLEDQRHRWGDVAWARGVLAQVAEGLAAIHALGIVHRDLKPGNILTRASGDEVLAKIADFGIARHEPPPGEAAVRGSPESPTLREGTPTLPKSSPLTETGVVIGTPRYMAPELVIDGRNARPASDVFAFGVLAFQVLTKKEPFDVAPSLAVTPASGRRRSIGEEAALDARAAEVLDRCLAHDHAERPSARELADALRGAPGG
jgi:serine/threonine-protein kinase